MPSPRKNTTIRRCTALRHYLNLESKAFRVSSSWLVSTQVNLKVHMSLKELSSGCWRAIMIAGRRASSFMWSLWSIWMESSMGITGLTYQETISIVYGGIPEKTTTARYTLSKNFCIRSIKQTRFLWSSTFMGTVILWIRFSMAIHLREKTHKILNCFLIIAAEKSSKYPSINRPLV